MNRNEAEIQLWAAFPGADHVQVQYLNAGKQMGVGVEFEGVRKGIAFDPLRHDIHSVIGQLKQQFEPN